MKILFTEIAEIQNFRAKGLHVSLTFPEGGMQYS